MLCKKHNLADPQNAAYVEHIATWIRSHNAHLRKEVTFALCTHSVVAGYEFIALEGWRQAPAHDLHWYASALESTIRHKSQLSMKAIIIVAQTLLASIVELDDKLPDLEYRERLREQDIYREQALRVIDWFCKVARSGEASTMPVTKSTDRGRIN